MPATNLLPINRVFREARDWHLARVPISSADLSKIGNAARLRSFWMSGVAHHASAVQAHRLLDEAIAKGATPAEWRAGLTAELAKNGGSVLPFARQNNILRTNTGLAYANGRLDQLRKPEILATRPIWMYPLGPHDAKTSQICLKMEGFMAEATWPGWTRVAPSNHFQERHLKLQSLTREQAAARGKIYDPPEGSGEYPVIDGQQILPDAGFDMPSDLLATDGKSLAAELKDVLHARHAKAPADYDLQPLKDLPVESRLGMPDLGDGTSADEAWEGLRDAFRFKADLDTTITPDLFNDGVVVNRGSFDAIFGEQPDLAPLLRQLLTEPTEVWFVPFEGAEGLVVLKRYIGVFTDGESALVLWGEQTPMGWLARGGTMPLEGAEALRHGYLASTRSATVSGGRS
jgi:hypothetical protein